MKKIAIVVAALALALTASAQSMYDAINFSSTNYYGTARSIGLGNAVTAVGGDLGTVNINPAGAAVAGYSQFTISPGISFSSTRAEYADVSRSSVWTSNKSRLSVPNCGFMFNFDTGNRSGIKSFTIGFVSNVNNNYFNSMDASHQVLSTSRFAENAAAAGGMSIADLSSYNAYFDTDINWDILTAYQANLFSDYGTDGLYAGNCEVISAAADYHYVPDALRQRVQTEKFGTKKDLVFNFAMNVSDRVFAGINIGVLSSEYGYSEQYSESPQHPDLFPLTFYKNGKAYDVNYKGGASKYDYANSYEGLYAQLGIIALPFDFLRLGVSFKTPAVMTINETWQYSASSYYSNAIFNGSASSPIGEYSYNLRSPYSASFGAAMTFGARWLISADYELTDYSIMKFTEIDSPLFGSDVFLDQNEQIGLFSGLSHSCRLGVEFRVSPTISIRGGYSRVSSPEKYYIDEFGKKVDANIYSSNPDYTSKLIALVSSDYVNTAMSSWSWGLGYSSRRSFFADFAFRRNTYSKETFIPYYDYDNYNKTGEMVNVPSPTITSKRSMVDVVMTFGWRF